MSIKSWFLWKGQLIFAKVLGKIFWPPASGFALIEKDDKLLVLDTGDYVMPPGGALKIGESFEEGVKREVLEETGYKVEIEDIIVESLNAVGGVEKGYKASIKENVKEKNSWELKIFKREKEFIYKKYRF
ncbi:MAG: NUDIX domain-containing protein [Candidatus Nanohaloarchaea archaeon]